MDEIIPKVSFYVFGVPVRNTVVGTWITMVFIILGVWYVRRTLPTALVMLIDFVRDSITGIMGSSVQADRYIPFLGTLVIFLLVANNIFVIPAIATPTMDINTPLALSIVVFFAVHYFGFREQGILGYLKARASPLLILDIISDVSRTLSLSLRLFGNILAGEVIVAVIYRLVGPLAPLPLIVLSLVTGVLQAYVYFVLTANAIASAVVRT